MNSLILMTTARYLMPLMLLFSVYLLLRGHNGPGGGFIGVPVEVTQTRRRMPCAVMALMMFAMDTENVVVASEP